MTKSEPEELASLAAEHDIELIELAYSAPRCSITPLLYEITSKKLHCIYKMLDMNITPTPVPLEFFEIELVS